MTIGCRAATAALAPCLALAAACDFFDPLSQPGLRLLVDPPDTAVYVGARFQARGVMRNSFGDLYPTAHVRFTGLDPSVTVTPGGIVLGVAYGRARVTGRREYLADTGWVSVVPQGTFAISGVSSTDVVNADGSGFITLVPAGDARGGAPSWLPGAAGVVHPYVVPGGTGEIALFVTDLAGHSRMLVPSGLHPRAARDGSWVYYMAGGTIWRVRPDGSGAEQITTSISYSHPDPSPDGAQLLVIRSGAPGGTPFGILVRDLTTGSERALGVGGFYPRWAPDGARIAYWSGDQSLGRGGTIAVVNADGTGTRQVSAAGRSYRADPLDWSPDGEWLIARADSSHDLIQVATGLTLPLGYSADHHNACWRW